MKTFYSSIAILALAVSALGCHTIKGVGDDVSTVGGWISGGSDHVKESIKNNPPGSKMEGKDAAK